MVQLDERVLRAVHERRERRELDGVDLPECAARVGAPRVLPPSGSRRARRSC